MIIGQGLFSYALMFLLAIVSLRFMLATVPLYAPTEPISIWYFLIVFLIVTLFFFLLVKRIKSRVFFEAFLTLAVFAGIWFLCDVWLPPDLAIITAFLITILKFIYARIWWQNLVMILGIAGIIISLGLSLPWLTALILLVVLSFYDIIAVYITGHMVKMFKGLVEQGVVFALIIPSRLRSLTKPLREVKPGVEFMLLGTGDLALPGLLVAALVRESVWQAIFAGVGAMIGFAFMNIIFANQEKRRPMPALPPIAAATIVGFLIAFVFKL